MTSVACGNAAGASVVRVGFSDLSGVAGRLDVPGVLGSEVDADGDRNAAPKSRPGGFPMRLPGALALPEATPIMCFTSDAL